MSVDISNLPPPPRNTPPKQEADVDISGLPAPPSSASAPVRTDTLPPPPASIASLPPPPESPEYQKLREEMDRGLVDNLSESPAFVSKEITDQDIDVIAQKHGVDTASLRKWLPFMGGSIPINKANLSDWAGSAAGIAGNVMFGIPQKLAKTAQTPEMERALDDLQELARARKSIAAATVETFAGPAGVFGQVGRGVSRQAAAGAVTGAAAGASSARQGDEVEGAVLGAGIGGVLGAGAEKLLGGRTTSGTGKSATEKQQTRRDRIIARGGADMQAGIEKAIEAAAAADDAIGRRIFNDAVLNEADAVKIVNAYAPESLEKLVDRNTEEGKLFLREMTRKLGQTPNEEQLRRLAIAKLSNDKVNSVAKQMAQEVDVDGDDAIAGLRDWAGLGKGSGQGEAAAKTRLAETLRANHVDEYIRERGLTAARTGFMGRVADFMSDAQYVLRGYDEKFTGLGLEDAHKEINRGLNLLSYPREEFRTRIRNIFDANRAAGVDKLAVDAEGVIRKVEAGEALSPQEERAFSGFRKFWADALEDIDKMAAADNVDPLGIKLRENYIPAQTKDIEELQSIMSDRLNNIVQDAQQINPAVRELRDITPDLYNALLNSSKEHMETVAFLRMISGEASERPQDLNKAFTQAFSGPSGSLKLDTIAKAALQRDGLIPMWARETNLYKLADKWTNNTLRHMYLRRGIDQLQGRLRNLETLAGSNSNEAKYVRNLLADLTGVRQGTAASVFSNAQRSYVWKLNKLSKQATNPVSKATYETLKMVPSVLQEMARSVYPNLLGASARAIVMNSTQTLTKTLPEFGAEYGSSLFFRGAMSVGGIKRLPQYLQELERAGLSPAKYVPAAQSYLREGLARSGAVNVPGRALNKIAEISMVPYTKAEEANRAIAWGASKMMANDLANGSSMARRALSKFPTSVRVPVERLLQEGNIEEAQEAIARHIINSTQYQYNRASMSEFGRTMGPLFATFSKWPTATLGQVIESFRTNGAAIASGDLAQKLVAPWALLEVADWAMGMESRIDTEQEGTDRQNRVFSKGGLSQSAPIGTLGGIISGDFFTPPVIDTALKTFATIDDTSKLQKAAANAVYTFAPFGLGGWVRFVTDDLVTVYTGERPEGSDFIERSAEGARTWGIK